MNKSSYSTCATKCGAAPRTHHLATAKRSGCYASFKYSMAAVESAESRFVSVSEDEITALLLDKDSVNTKLATEVSIGVLQLYLHEKGQSTDFVSLPVASLNELLKKFMLKRGERTNSLTQSRVSQLYALDYAVISKITDQTWT